MEIKDYCKIYNIIPKDICEKVIREHKDHPNWVQHAWYSAGADKYGPQHNRELDVLFNNVDYIDPYIHQAMLEYLIELNMDMIVSFCSELRLNKYSVGTIMSPHYDLIRRNKDDGIPVISMILVFNDDFEGGNFTMNDEVIKLSQGDVLLFPSTFLYRHGVTEVTKGTRFSGVIWAY